jgi:N6-adenosine-specific RNA methylase IME4
LFALVDDEDYERLTTVKWYATEVEHTAYAQRSSLFARRHRLGWDVWGNESANTANLGAVS